MRVWPNWLNCNLKNFCGYPSEVKRCPWKIFIRNQVGVQKVKNNRRNSQAGQSEYFLKPLYRLALILNILILIYAVTLRMMMMMLMMMMTMMMIMITVMMIMAMMTIMTMMMTMVMMMMAIFIKRQGPGGSLAPIDK